MYQTPPMPLGIYNNIERQKHRSLQCCRFVSECCPNDFIPPVLVPQKQTPSLYIITFSNGVTIDNINVMNVDETLYQPLFINAYTMDVGKATVIHTDPLIKTVNPFNPPCNTNYYLEITLSNGEVLFTDLFRVVDDDNVCCLIRIDYTMNCDKSHIVKDFQGRFYTACMEIIDDAKEVKESDIMPDGNEMIKSFHIQEAIKFRIKPLYDTTVKWLKSLQMYDNIRITLPDGMMYELLSINIDERVSLLDNCLFEAEVRATTKTIMMDGCCDNYENDEIIDGLNTINENSLCDSCYCIPPYNPFILLEEAGGVWLGYLESDINNNEEYSLDDGISWATVTNNPFFVPIVNCDDVTVQIRTNCLNDCYSEPVSITINGNCIECPKPVIQASVNCNTINVLLDDPGVLGITQYYWEWREISDPNFNINSFYPVGVGSAVAGVTFGQTYVIRACYVLPDNTLCPYSYLNVTIPTITYSYNFTPASCGGQGKIEIFNAQGVGVVNVTINGVTLPINNSQSVPAGSYVVTIQDNCQTITLNVVIETIVNCAVITINPAINISSDGNIAFSWNADPNATSYEVQIRALPNGTWSTPISTTDTEYEYENLDCDSYAIRVRAINCGVYCEWSEVVTVQIECNCCELGILVNCELEDLCDITLPYVAAVVGGQGRVTFSPTGCTGGSFWRENGTNTNLFFPLAHPIQANFAAWNNAINGNINFRYECGNCRVQFKFSKSVTTLTAANFVGAIGVSIISITLIDPSLQTTCLSIISDDQRCSGDLPILDSFEVSTDGGATFNPYIEASQLCGIGFGDHIIVRRSPVYANSPCPDDVLQWTITMPTYTLGAELCSGVTVIKDDCSLPCACLNCHSNSAPVSNVYNYDWLGKADFIGSNIGGIYTFEFIFTSLNTPLTTAQIAQIYSDFNGANGLFSIAIHTDPDPPDGIYFTWVKCGIIEFDIQASYFKIVIDTNLGDSCLDIIASDIGLPANYSSVLIGLFNGYVSVSGINLDMISVLATIKADIIG